MTDEEPRTPLFRAGNTVRGGSPRLHPQERLRLLEENALNQAALIEALRLAMSNMADEMYRLKQRQDGADGR